MQRSHGNPIHRLEGVAVAISSGLLTSGIQAYSGWDAATSENLENIVEICRAPAAAAVSQRKARRSGGKGEGGEKRDHRDGLHGCTD